MSVTTDILIDIDLYGRLADAAGRRVRLFATNEPLSIMDLRHQLASAYPELAAYIVSNRVRACVNDRIVGDDYQLSSNDRIAFFPPVSGG